MWKISDLVHILEVCQTWLLQIHELFLLFDTDSDGSISKNDFNMCLRKNPLLIALFSPQLLRSDFPSRS